MKILITGGTGFIGSHTVVELLKKDYECVIVDNLSNSDISVVDKIKNITGKTIDFFQIDLLNIKSLEEVFKKHNFDAVIHFAGLKAVGESIDKPLLYYETNLLSTINVLKLMEIYNIKKFIFSSSATVYGNSPSPMTENSKTGDGITNPYGMTKYMIEKILEDYIKTDKHLRIISLRYFNPVGAHSSGLIGENPKDNPNNLMPYVARVAVQNNTSHYYEKKYNQVNIFGNDYNTKDGTGLRDYIHVVDLAEAHVKAYENIKIGYDFVNLGTGEGTTVLELIKCFEKVNKINIPYKIVERRPGDLEEVYCSPKKAKKLLNWEAKKTLEDMCRDVWNFQQKNMPELIIYK